MRKLEALIPYAAIVQLASLVCSYGLLAANNGYTGFLALVPMGLGAALVAATIGWLLVQAVRFHAGHQPSRRALVAAGVILLSPLIWWWLQNLLPY